MYAVSKSEMLHSREHRAERIVNLCSGRYLPVPVKVTAVDIDGKSMRLGLLMRRHLHSNFRVSENEFGILEPEVLCCAHKLQESWHRKRELVGNVDLEFLETGGGDPINNCFHVSTNTLERKTVKIRKHELHDGRHDRRMRELPFYFTVGNGNEKVNNEVLQQGHK